MKRTIDDEIKQKQLQVYDGNNFYLSEEAKIYWIDVEKLRNPDCEFYIFLNNTATLVLDFIASDQLLVRVDYNQSNVIIGLAINGPIESSESQWRLQNNEEITIKLKNPIEKSEEEKMTFSQYFSSYLAICVWIPGFPELEKNSLYFTDCIIRAKNDEITFPADVKKLVTSSEVLANMIRDLDANFSYKNPFDFSEIFKGFHYQEILLYLCCLYSKSDYVPENFFQTISVLKICAKLNNKQMIKRIFGQKSFAYDFRNQVVRDDTQHPLHYQNILQFARQHDFHKLEILCNLELLQCEGDISEDDDELMKEISEAYRGE